MKELITGWQQLSEGSRFFLICVTLLVIILTSAVIYMQIKEGKE